MTTNPAAECAVLTTTTDAEEKARALAARIVEEQLAACAQVFPVSSVYRWQGAVEEAREWRIDFKTRRELVTELGRRIGDLHEYDTPEIVAVPVTGGSVPYLEWVKAQTAPAGAEGRTPLS